MNPMYFHQWEGSHHIDLEWLLTRVDWQRHTSARQESFMALQPTSYQYGAGPNARSYQSQPMLKEVEEMMGRVNETLSALHLPSVNGCFLNLYTDQLQHLGWHSDNFVGMDDAAPIVVHSIGQAREIWFRAIGHKGEVPASDRLMLEDRSLLIMPPNYQRTHQHRIPKGDRAMGARVSLTFRAFFPQ